MPHSRLAFILLLIWAAAASILQAQPGSGASDRVGSGASDRAGSGGSDGGGSAPGLSDEAVISLLTILPGNDIYSLWGHSAVRVSDPLRGLDVSFNYGTFQFDAYFVPKFMYGELDYLLSVQDYELAIESYHAERRPVIEQVLEMTPAQKDSLFAFLRINARPENRVYRYHFVYDNCSTRIRDALQQSLGEEVRFTAAPDPGLTFRELTDGGLENRPFLDAGIDWLFGATVDRVAEPYETMFLPLYLMEAFDGAEIRLDGSWSPLVARTDTVFWNPRPVRAVWQLPLASILAWILFVAGALLTLQSPRSGVVVHRWFDVPLFLVVGFAGILITFLWFISLHDVTEHNWHLLWSWPTHIIAGVVLWRRSTPRWLGGYLLAAALLAIVAALLGWVVTQWIHPALYALMLLTALRAGWIFYAIRRRQPAATV